MVILSLVRSSPGAGDVSFTSNPKRLNVMLTRAEDIMWVVCNTQMFLDSTTLKVDKPWCKQLVQDAFQRAELADPTAWVRTIQPKEAREYPSIPDRVVLGDSTRFDLDAAAKIPEPTFQQGEVCCSVQRLQPLTALCSLLKVPKAVRPGVCVGTKNKFRVAVTASLPLTDQVKYAIQQYLNQVAGRFDLEVTEVHWLAAGVESQTVAMVTVANLPPARQPSLANRWTSSDCDCAYTHFLFAVRDQRTDTTESPQQWELYAYWSTKMYSDKKQKNQKCSEDRPCDTPTFVILRNLSPLATPADVMQRIGTLLQTYGAEPSDVLNVVVQKHKATGLSSRKGFATLRSSGVAELLAHKFADSGQDTRAFPLWAGAEIICVGHSASDFDQTDFDAASDNRSSAVAAAGGGTGNTGGQVCVCVCVCMCIVWLCAAVSTTCASLYTYACTSLCCCPPLCPGRPGPPTTTASWYCWSDQTRPTLCRISCHGRCQGCLSGVHEFSNATTNRHRELCTGAYMYDL